LIRGYGKVAPWLLVVCVIIPVIVIAKHHANIRRLLMGTEYRFGRSKAAAA
jgi:glycerol-3-phosphate acyltransferase PlsY